MAEKKKQDDPKLEEPAFDEHDKCTNLGKCGNANTTVPRTPLNPGGHFEKEHVRTEREALEAEAVSTAADAAAALAKAEIAESASKEAANKSHKASLAAADAKADAEYAREIADAAKKPHLRKAAAVA